VRRHIRSGVVPATTRSETARLSRLLEVQGFGQRFVDANTNTVGNHHSSANQISRYITFSVTRRHWYAGVRLGLHQWC
jgi:hypothetical protein